MDYTSVDFFRNVPLFRALDGDELTAVLRRTDPVVYQAGNYLFREGDAGDGLYLIERGELEVSMNSGGGRDLVLAHLGNGSVIGEMALIDGGPRSATVAAFAQTQGYFLSRAKFDRLSSDGKSSAYSKIVYRLAQTLEERRCQVAERIQHLREDPDLGSQLFEQATKELIARMRKA